jgi:hypothetical protein
MRSPIRAIALGLTVQTAAPKGVVDVSHNI